MSKFLDENGNWKCTACGMCCRHPSTVKWLKEQTGEDFDRGDGLCKHLTDDNRCRIYTIRPHGCNTANYSVSAERMAAECESYQEA